MGIGGGGTKASDAAGLEGLGPCLAQLQGVPQLVQCTATHDNPIFSCSLLDELVIFLRLPQNLLDGYRV